MRLHKGAGRDRRFVASHNVLVVKADGYNRRADQPYYVRPYNVGPVETYRQFPLYFPELVAHIDATYSTIADRVTELFPGFPWVVLWLSGSAGSILIWFQR